MADGQLVSPIGPSGDQLSPTQHQPQVVGVPRSVAAFQGASNVTVTGGHISVVGGDSHTHTHIHYHVPSDSFAAVLRAIANHRKIHQDTLARATPRTMEWLFGTEYFTFWWNKDGGFKVLWGSGIPGAGKTVLTSLVIQEVERRTAAVPEQICVAYFYMRYNDHTQMSVRSVLEVLFKQSVERHDHLVPIAEAVYGSHIREGTQPTEDELLGLLREFVAHMASTFYFLDALDEAPVEIQYALVEKLVSLNAQLFITSRPMKDVQSDFPEASFFDIAAQDEDIELHISKRLQNNPRLRKLLDRGGASLKENLVSTIKSKCGGMFLHASLQLEALQRCLSTHDVMRTLEQFPARVEDVYHTTWKRIMDQDPEHAALAQAAFLWVLYAQRPLAIEELCCAIATCPRTHRFEPDRAIPESTITDLCHGLLIVHEESKQVRLVHYTAKGPLEALLLDAFPHPHSVLAAVCTTRLIDCGFHDTAIASREELIAALAKEPLLDYAYGAWVVHVQRSLDVKPTLSLARAFAMGCRLFPISTSQRYYRDFDLGMGLHLVAFYDLPIALAGPHDGGSINALTQIQKRTALHLACARGHSSAAQSLLRLPNVDPNAKDYEGLTALVLATINHYTETVAILLSHLSVEVNITDDVGWAALMHASCGRPGIARLLLAHPNIEVNLVDMEGKTPLLIACEENKGDVAIPKLLLAHPGVEVNVAGPFGLTPLSIASYFGYSQLVELLLNIPGIEINPVNQAGETPIRLAAERGHEDIVRMLLNVPGINTMPVGADDGHTAMSAAASKGHDGIVRLLEEFEAAG